MSGLPWFRMYVDFLEDPKILSLAFEDQRHFIAILALKSAGVIDQDCDPVVMNKIVAQKLWVDHSAIVEVKRRLVEAKLIDQDWQPLAWEKRQRRSDHDPSGAERQRRYREKSKGSNGDSNALRNANNNVKRNAAVTLPDKIRREKKRKEKDPPAHECANPEYPSEFESLWNAYPKRFGSNPKSRAYRSWEARRKEGHSAESMYVGAKRYANHIKARGKEGTEFVMQAATFLGPENHFYESWEDPKKSDHFSVSEAERRFLNRGI